MTHSTTHDTAQHITAPFIGWQNAISNKERRCAKMISDNAMARLPFWINSSGFGHSANEGAHRIGFIIVMCALKQSGNTLKPHARIDGRFRQCDALGRRHLLELHKHEIPNLDKAITIRISRTRRAAGNFITMIEENFRTGATRTRVTHCPEIVRSRNANNL